MTVLVGSTIHSQVPVLGNKGAAGLAWGTLRIFLSYKLVLLQQLRTGCGRPLVSEAWRPRCCVESIFECEEFKGQKPHWRSDWLLVHKSKGKEYSQEMFPQTTSRHVYLLAPDVYFADRMRREAWIDSWGIFASLAVLVEVAILWRQEATNLCLINGCSWLFFPRAHVYCRFWD